VVQQNPTKNVTSSLKRPRQASLYKGTLPRTSTYLVTRSWCRNKEVCTPRRLEETRSHRAESAQKHLQVDLRHGLPLRRPRRPAPIESVSQNHLRLRLCGIREPPHLFRVVPSQVGLRREQPEVRKTGERGKAPPPPQAASNTD